MLHHQSAQSQSTALERTCSISINYPISIFCLLQDLFLNLRARRSIESVLRLHPKTKIILNLVLGVSNRKEAVNSSTDANTLKQLETQFEVFNQAGYDIKLDIKIARNNLGHFYSFNGINCSTSMIAIVYCFVFYAL